MKKTILQYMTDIYQEDIPKHILQENKIRLNSFFLEQESVQKKGTQFIFRYAFYSVEKPRKITKQHLLKEYAGVPLEKRSVQPEQIPDMKQYSDIILYGDASSPEAQQQLAEYLQRKHSVNHVFSSPTSIINFTSKKPSYDDTRRSGRDNELLQRAQNDL